MCWLIPGAAIFAAGLYLVLTATGFDIIVRIPAGFACFFIAAIILARPVSRLIAEPTGGLFYPTAQYDRPQPMYSIPETLRKQGNFEEAMAKLEEIADQYPDEVKPYVEMLNIAVLNLKDMRRAERIYLRGITSLEDKEKREMLAHVFRIIDSRGVILPRT